MLRAVLYTADPWESALAEIRVRRPAVYAKIEILQGVKASKVDQSLVSQADLVIIQRDFPRFPESSLVIQTAKSLKKPVIYETDDWLFNVPDWNVQQTAYKNYLNAMLSTVIQADRVLTCTPLLAEKLALFNSNVRVFNNYLVDELWPLRPPTRAAGSPLKIGFMGSPTHQEDIRWLSPVIKALLDQYTNKVSMVFWGCEPPEDLRERPDVQWNAEQFQSYSEFAGYFSQQFCDIFIAPLNNNEFNQAKSSLKYLEYSSLGIPGVYSKINPYEMTITDGENGLLAGSHQEWHEKIEALIQSSDLRYHLANEAQKRVARDWLLSDHFQLWQDAVSETSSGDNIQGPAQLIINHITQKTQLQIWEMEAKIKLLEEEAASSHTREVDLRNHLDAVLTSNTWKLALQFQKLIDLVRPRH